MKIIKYVIFIWFIGAIASAVIIGHGAYSNYTNDESVSKIKIEQQLTTLSKAYTIEDGSSGGNLFVSFMKLLGSLFMVGLFFQFVRRYTTIIRNKDDDK